MRLKGDSVAVQWQVFVQAVEREAGVVWRLGAVFAAGGGMDFQSALGKGTGYQRGHAGRVDAYRVKTREADDDGFACQMLFGGCREQAIDLDGDLGGQGQLAILAQFVNEALASEHRPSGA